MAKAACAGWRFWAAFVLLLAALLLVSACSSKATPQAPQPLPQEDPAAVKWGNLIGGVRYVIVADKELNLSEAGPLAITLCVYQFHDLAAFQNRATTASGIDKLLDCTIEKGDSNILSARSFYLQPGDVRDVGSDRMENARYLAAVAGFVHLQPSLSVAVFPFPLHEEKQGIFRTTVYRAAAVDAQIHLGAEAVSLTGVERVEQ